MPQAVLIVVGRVETPPLRVRVTVKVEAADAMIGGSVVIVIVDDEAVERLFARYAIALDKDRLYFGRRDMFERRGRAEEVHTAIG